MTDTSRAITITIDDDCLQRLIIERLDELINQDVTGVTWSLDQFRRYCCANKAKDWVKAFIFIPFADEIACENGGWLIFPRGKGHCAIIFAKQAKEWMENNHHRINWRGKLKNWRKFKWITKKNR